MEHHKKIKEGIFLFKGKVQEHTDERRSIKDIALPHLPGFSIRQVKRMDFEKKGIVVGNHFHTRESGRIEVYIAMGTPKRSFSNSCTGKKVEGLEKYHFFRGMEFLYRLFTLTPSRSFTKIRRSGDFQICPNTKQKRT